MPIEYYTWSLSVPVTVYVPAPIVMMMSLSGVVGVLVALLCCIHQTSSSGIQ